MRQCLVAGYRSSCTITETKVSTCKILSCGSKESVCDVHDSPCVMCMIVGLRSLRATCWISESEVLMLSMKGLAASPKNACTIYLIAKSEAPMLKRMSRVRGLRTLVLGHKSTSLLLGILRRRSEMSQNRGIGHASAIYASRPLVEAAYRNFLQTRAVLFFPSFTFQEIFV